MDWAPPAPKYSTQVKDTGERSRFAKLLGATPEEQEKLDILGLLESSGDPSAQHQLIRDPASMHKDSRAIGEYGLMPQTVAQIMKEAKDSGTMGPEMLKTDRFNIHKDLENNLALQNEIALAHLRKSRRLADTDRELRPTPATKDDEDVIRHMQGPGHDSTARDLLLLDRPAKANEARLKQLKDKFSK